MEEFKKKVMAHVEHIKAAGSHCTTEETTKQALILPLLSILDFNAFDPQKVRAEYAANFPGAKASERVDYALFTGDKPVMFIEAKPFNAKLTNHDGQLSRYFNATPGVKFAVITNGVEWRFFTDLKERNIMDTSPFFTVNFDKLDDKDIEQLAKFRYDMFNPDALKSFAEERYYLDLFAVTIESCLRDIDLDFVKFIANRAKVAPSLTTKFLESITPLINQSLKDAIRQIVVSGLSTPLTIPVADVATPDISEIAGDTFDPVNPKIVTTATERKLLEIVKDMLSGVVNVEDISGKDTESYFNVLYQGKSNRCIVRYSGDKKKPQAIFPIELTEAQKSMVIKRGLEFGAGGSIILDKPESIMRISEIIFESLAYCQDDMNFKKGKKEEN